MVLIEAQEPRTVALGILLLFYLGFILVLPYFRFRSVLSNVQASSRKISEALRATQRQQYWRYIESIIGTTSIPALKGEAGTFAAPIGEARRICSANNKIFVIFQNRRASPISGVRIVAPIVLAQHKERERIGKAQTPVRRASPIVIELAY